MILKEQILTIIFSFIYGCIFYILLLLNKKILFSSSFIKNLISNFLFIIDLTLIYFIIIKYINNAIINLYSFIFIILGVVISNLVIKKLKTYKK